MATPMCRTCGVQYAAGERPPPRCMICEDERQYVGWQGQQWTTLEEMRRQGLHNRFEGLEPGLTGISTEPPFAIGQRALLVQTERGNVLWDCISFLDDETVRRVRELGGLHAITVSHPHFYAAMVEWSHAFGRVPVVLPWADREWVTRPDPVIEFYDGRRELLPGVTVIQCGGHFDGSAVLHWAHGAGGRGVLLVGDTMTVTQDRRHVSFMYSYPNLIPLPAATIRRVVAAVGALAFERIYGAWWGREILQGAKEAVERSAMRYIGRLR